MEAELIRQLNFFSTFPLFKETAAITAVSFHAINVWYSVLADEMNGLIRMIRCGQKNLRHILCF